ncbi:unnamed protein product [Rotaria sp. Silwood2]|nr:unnamed protein product [Rotaria sp. Silwood2]CAF3003605.1 unnamed protein product [Rotaria sp. Silwood2]CAF3311921.1 unnamed protein product [Rotaria sp. Silwood2]CAF4223525.1 unnamed protein product [Rotaria sp. Silwood2]CAF4234172.1 unnamed protein product [Rotaria sp. Silwood2]
MSDTIGEKHGAGDIMDVVIPPKYEKNPDAEEVSSMTSNVGSGTEIDNRSYSSPSPYSDEPGGRINRTTSSNGSNIQIDSSTSVYDRNIRIGRQLYHLTNTIKQLTTNVGSLNQNMKKLHEDMANLTSGRRDLRNHIGYLKDDFNNRNVTSGGAGGDSYYIK